MNGRMKSFLKIGFLAAVAAAGVSLFFTSQKGVDSDLVALLGDAADGGLRKAAAATSVSAKFLVKAASREEATARLKALGVDIRPCGPDSRIVQALCEYAHGFLSPSTRELLERGEFAAVRDAAAARLFSPVPPVLAPQKDPFLLFTDYVLSNEERRGEWIAVRTELTAAQALAALVAVNGAEDVRCAGSPFHTAVASENSKKEINALSAISLFCVLLFGRMLTGSFKFVPVLLLALASSFSVSSAAVFAFFEKPHAIAFVFGTTLIGMGVDYVYHAMMARGSIAKPLSVSYLSTSACFLPLLFSKVEVLNQMAVFTVAGLTAIFAGVIVFGLRNQAQNDPSPALADGCGRFAFKSALRMGLALLLFLLVPLWILARNGMPVQPKADITRMYRPDPYLAEGERIALEISGGSGFVPSAKDQRRNIRLVERLFETEGTNYCAMTGLPLSVLELPEKRRVFAPRECIEASLDRWEAEARKIHFATMLILGVLSVVVFGWMPAAEFIAAMLCAYTGVSSILLLLGERLNFFATICFFIFMGLGFDYCVFRRHMLKSGDCDAGKKAASRAVFYSFLTSFIGFGLLSFTDFAVTRIMGITLASGLAISYVAAVLFCGCFEFDSIRGKKRDDASAVWHEQRERCASLFWAKFMWYSYAWFGKNFQKVIFVIGMPVIYLLSGPARVSLAKFYAVLSEFTGKEMRATFPRLFMHILGFAWGLMDKTDSCTLGKNPPVMSVRDDEAWRAFLETVNSGKGAFLLCTHEGTIGVLPSLPDALRRSSTDAAVRNMRIPKVNAFQQMGHDAVFMKVFMEHFDASRLRLHAVEDIGVETAVEMKSAIERGELVIMAGDRVGAGSSSVTVRRFMGRDCMWPKGVYRFAKLMESPVFAVTCVRTGWNSYEVHFAALSREPSAMLDGFVTFLERETVAHPEQWYQFYDFFGAISDEYQKPISPKRR